MAAMRDDRFTTYNTDGTVYTCGDDGMFCELRDIDGIVTCVNCGDQPGREATS